MATLMGVGTSSSPIIIEDSDDEGVDGTRSRSSPLALALHRKGTARPHIAKGNAIVRGKGYNILVRMGYQPGRGLGLNLEGAAEPIRITSISQHGHLGLGVAAANTGSESPKSVEDPRQPTLPVATHAPSYVVAPTKENIRKGRTTNGKDRTLTKKQKEKADAVLRTQVNQVTAPVPTTPSMTSVAQKPDKNKKKNLAPMIYGEVSVQASESSNQRTQSYLGAPAEAGPSRVPHPASSPLPDPQFYEAAYDSPSPISPDPFAFPMSYQQSQWTPQSSMMTIAMPHPLSGAPFPALSSGIPFALPGLGGFPVLGPTFPTDPEPGSFLSHVAVPPSLPPKPPSTNSKRRQSSYDKAGIAYVPEKGTIGVQHNSSQTRRRGFFAELNSPNVSPDCTLVLEDVPRKHRTDDFVHSWLAQFESIDPVARFQLGGDKIFVEFSSAKDAVRAFKSPRMGGTDGLTGVRAWWYEYHQDHGQHQDKQEDSEADVTTQEQTLASHCALPPLRDCALASDAIVPDAWEISEQSRQFRRLPHINCPPTMTPSHLPSDSTASLVPPPNSPAHTFQTIISPPALDSPLSVPPPSISSQPHETPTFQTIPSSPPKFSPSTRVPNNSLTPSTKRATLVVKIAAARAEMSAVTAPLSSTQESTSSKEEHLRQLVLRSKRKRMTNGTIAQGASTPVAEVVAEDFIRDTVSRSRPTKRIKIDPKEIETCHRRLLMHLHEAKRLIRQLENPHSKVNRAQVIAGIKRHDLAAQQEKLVIMAMTNANSSPPPQDPIWPETSEVCILDISDSEDDDCSPPSREDMDWD